MCKDFVKYGLSVVGCSHVINVKDTKEFSKDQDPVNGVLKGENRKLKAGL